MDPDDKDFAREALNGFFRRRGEAGTFYCTACLVILFGRGALTVLVDGRARPFDPDAFAACRAAGPGYSMAFDATTRTKSTADTVAFLQRHLRP